MNWKNQIASVLLAVAILNPLCCCLGEVLTTVFSDSGQSFSCCDQQETAECPEEVPKEPCDCEKQVTAHKEAWPEDRLLSSVEVSVRAVWEWSLWTYRSFVVPDSVQDVLTSGPLPSWKLHCVRLL